MTKINIPLNPDLVGIELPDIADPKLVKHQPYLETLGRALESPRGLRIEFANAAAAINARFRYYRARTYVNKRGIKSFDGLTLQVDDKYLLIRKDLPPVIEEL